MGLTTFKGDIPVLSDVVIAKNYLSEEELRVLNNLVEFDLIKTKSRRKANDLLWQQNFYIYLNCIEF